MTPHLFKKQSKYNGNNLPESSSEGQCLRKESEKLINFDEYNNYHKNSNNTPNSKNTNHNLNNSGKYLLEGSMNEDKFEITSSKKKNNLFLEMDIVNNSYNKNAKSSKSPNIGLKQRSSCFFYDMENRITEKDEEKEEEGMESLCSASASVSTPNKNQGGSKDGGEEINAVSLMTIRSRDSSNNLEGKELNTDRTIQTNNTANTKGTKKSNLSRKSRSVNRAGKSMSYDSSNNNICSPNSNSGNAYRPGKPNQNNFYDKKSKHSKSSSKIKNSKSQRSNSNQAKPVRVSKNNNVNATNASSKSTPKTHLSKTSVIKKHFGEEAAELMVDDPMQLNIYTPRSRGKLQYIKSPSSNNTINQAKQADSNLTGSINKHISSITSRSQGKSVKMNTLNLNNIKDKSSLKKTSLISKFNGANFPNIEEENLNDPMEYKAKKLHTRNTHFSGIGFERGTVTGTGAIPGNDLTFGVGNKNTPNSINLTTYRSIFSKNNQNDLLIIKNNKRRNNVLSHNNDLLKMKYWQRRSFSEEKQQKGDLNQDIVILSVHRLLEKERKKNEKKLPKEQKPSELLKYIKMSSLCIFHIDSPFRRALIYICNQKAFDIVFILMTFASCIVIVMQTSYLDPESSKANTLKIIDSVFIWLFLVENLMKIIAYGFIFDNYKALGDPSEMKMSEKLEQMELQEMSVSEIIENKESQVNSLNKSDIKGIGYKEGEEYDRQEYSREEEEEGGGEKSKDNDCNNDISHHSSSIDYKQQNHKNTPNPLSKGNDFLHVKDSLVESHIMNQNELPRKKSNLENSIRSQKSNKDQSSILSLNNNEDKSPDSKLRINKTKKKKLMQIIQKTKFIPGLRKAFMKDFINVIDLITVISSILYFFQLNSTTQGDELKSLRVLRGLGALRPIKLASKFQEMRVAVECLLMSIPAIVKMFIVGFFVFLAFGISGIHIFGGLLGTCENPTFRTSEDCRNFGFIWTAEEINFDNINESLATLLQMSTAQSYVNLMQRTEIATSKFSNLYFLLFMIICSIFIINIAVTVIVDNYIRLSEAEQGLSILTDNQKTWFKTMKIFLKYRPTPNLIPQKMVFIKKWAFIIVSDPVFKVFVNIIILVNMIGILITYDRMPEQHADFQSHLFYTCTAIFNIEILLKIIAYGKFFFIYKWNVFDLVVVLLGDIHILLDFIVFVLEADIISDSQVFYNLYIVINATKALRVVRAINIHPTLRDYVSALLLIVPSLLNIGLLILLNLFVFAIIGMAMFGTVKHYNYINDNVNFESFLNAVLILIRTNTGEEWNMVMNELAQRQEGCKDNQTIKELEDYGPNGCGSSFSYSFFTVFIIYNTFIVMNMLVAVIVEGFLFNIDDDIQITEPEIENFFSIWGSYDQDIEYEMTLSNFALMLLDLKEPLGLYEEEYQKFQPGRKYSNKIYISNNDDYVLDDHKVLLIYQNFDIICVDGKINIIDAIKLIINRVFTRDHFANLEAEKNEEDGKGKKKIASNYLLNKKLQEELTHFWSKDIQTEEKKKKVKETASIYLAKKSLKKLWIIYKSKRNRQLTYVDEIHA